MVYATPTVLILIWMANFSPLILIMNAASHSHGMNRLGSITWFQEEDMAGGIRSNQKPGARHHRMLISFHLSQLRAGAHLQACFATRERISPRSIRDRYSF